MTSCAVNSHVVQMCAAEIVILLTGVVSTLTLLEGVMILKMEMIIFFSEVKGLCQSHCQLRAVTALALRKNRCYVMKFSC